MPTFIIKDSFHYCNALPQSITCVLMRAMIRTLKEDIDGKDTLLKRAGDLSMEIHEVENSVLFSPKPGKLFDLLNLLRQNGVNYTTNFNVDDEMKS